MATMDTESADQSIRSSHLAIFGSKEISMSEQILYSERAHLEHQMLIQQQQQLFLFQQRCFHLQEHNQQPFLQSVDLEHPSEQLIAWSYSEAAMSTNTAPVQPPIKNTPDSPLLFPRDDPKSRVRFTPILSVYVNSVDSEEVFQDYWYSKNDLRSFKGERKDIIRMLRRVNFDASRIDTTAYDLRGLEPYSSVCSIYAIHSP
jgi:hypothetical protein